MAELFLILRLAGERVAFPAADVEAVIELGPLTPVPRAAPHVAGLAALRSRILTVVDGAAALGAPPQRGASEAVIVPSEGHPYAIMVEGVEDVVEAAAAGTHGLRPGADWARVARGTVDTGEALLLLVDPHALIAGPADVTVAA